MTTEELNTVLCQKMYEEQERFKEELRNASPQEIMLNAYELVIREDILLHLEENDLSGAQARALLKSEHPLSDLFNAWETGRVIIWKRFAKQLKITPTNSLPLQRRKQIGMQGR